MSRVIASAILSIIIGENAAACAARPCMLCGQVVAFVHGAGWFVNGMYAGESSDAAGEALARAILDSKGVESWDATGAPSMDVLCSAQVSF